MLHELSLAALVLVSWLAIIATGSVVMLRRSDRR